MRLTRCCSFYGYRLHVGRVGWFADGPVTRKVRRGDSDYEEATYAELLSIIRGSRGRRQAAQGRLGTVVGSASIVREASGRGRVANFSSGLSGPASVRVLLTLTPTAFREWSTRTSCRPAEPFERKPGNQPRGHAAFCQHVRRSRPSHEESLFRFSVLTGVPHRRAPRHRLLLTNFSKSFHFRLSFTRNLGKSKSS